MGALVTRALRPIKSFNIENRAHRVIAKEKPVPAPRYPQNYEDIKRALESDPDLDEKLDKKNKDLDIKLRDVYVTVEGRPEDDITREKRNKNPNRPLPESRNVPDDYEFGFYEPVRITYGKTTLRKAVEFISAHQVNPMEATPEKIALEYKLKLEDVNNILKYFKTFEVYIPATKKTPAVFAGPSTMRKQIQNLDLSSIEGQTPEKESKEVSLDETASEERKLKESVPEITNVEVKNKN